MIWFPLSDEVVDFGMRIVREMWKWRGLKTVVMVTVLVVVVGRREGRGAKAERKRGRLEREMKSEGSCLEFPPFSVFFLSRMNLHMGNSRWAHHPPFPPKGMHEWRSGKSRGDLYDQTNNDQTNEQHDHQKTRKSEKVKNQKESFPFFFFFPFFLCPSLHEAWVKMKK